MSVTNPRAGTVGMILIGAGLAAIDAGRPRPYPRGFESAPAPRMLPGLLRS